VAHAIPDGPFGIRSKYTNMCLEVYQGSLVPATRVVQWPCHGGQHQLWRINDLGNGYVQLQVEHSAQCLEVDNAGGAGAYALQWPCHGGTHQQWRRVGDKFMARHSGLFLEVEAASRNPGAWVVTWFSHNGLHQRWAAP
jgi:hypothetical protein